MFNDDTFYSLRKHKHIFSLVIVFTLLNATFFVSIQYEWPLKADAQREGFMAKGTINSLIFTPGTKWIATGNWSMNANNGRLTSFDTNMTWFNNNGTATHTHEFQNFKSSGGKIITAQGPSNNVILKGVMDVGTNHRIIWKSVPTTININGEKTITIALDNKKTNFHFAGQPIFGVVTSFTRCSDVPGPNMEVLPSCILPSHPIQYLPGGNSNTAIPYLPGGNSNNTELQPPQSQQLSSPATIQNSGTLTIKQVVVGTDKLLSNAAFKITPNPFTLKGSLVVHDNNRTLDSDPAGGVVLLRNVKFSPYLINETKASGGFGPVLLKARITVHKTNPNPIVIIEDRDIHKPFTGSAKVLAPYLNDSSFRIFVSRGAKVGSTPIYRVDQLPSALIVTSEKQNNTSTSPLLSEAISKPITFNNATAPVTYSASQIFKLFKIPTYPAPVKDIASHIIYFSPVFVIKQNGSKNNNFILTPIVAKIFPGMTMLLNHSSSVASRLAKVEEIKMRFAENGTNVGFSFGTSDTIPSALRLPRISNYTLALFLNIGFVGGGGKKEINFSIPNAFISSPQINMRVSKLLNTTKLVDGCPDINSFSFNESAGNWQTSNKPIRDIAIDTPNECGYTLQTGHFSKFAVGGVKPSSSPPSVSLEQ